MQSRYRGQEIAVRAISALVHALWDAGVNSPRLPSKEDLSSTGLRMSWDRLRSILKIARATFSDEQLIGLGAKGLELAPYETRITWAKRLLTLEDAYRFMVFPHEIIDYGCMMSAVDATPGRIQITAILGDGYEPSNTFFLIMQGAATALPKLYGITNANVRGDLTDRYMHFDIRFDAFERPVHPLKRWFSEKLRNIYCAWHNVNANSELVRRTFALESALRRRDEANSALLRDRERQQQRMQNLTEVVVEFDDLNQIYFLSPNTEKVFGYPNEVLLNDPLKILQPQARAAAEATLANPALIPNGIYQVDAAHADGSTFRLDVDVRHFVDELGQRRWIATLRPSSTMQDKATPIKTKIPLLLPKTQTKSDGQPKLLLVDDNDLTRRVAEKILSSAGYSVICVAESGDVLQKVQQEEFSGLVLDINMPGMSGIEVYESLREGAIDLPVIFVSGDAEQLRKKHPELPFVRKPFRSEQLVQTVRAVTSA